MAGVAYSEYQFSFRRNIPPHARRCCESPWQVGSFFSEKRSTNWMDTGENLAGGCRYYFVEPQPHQLSFCYGVSSLGLILHQNQQD